MQASDVEDIIARLTWIFLDRERISTVSGTEKEIKWWGGKSSQRAESWKRKEEQSAANKQQSNDNANGMKKVSSQNPDEMEKMWQILLL